MGSDALLKGKPNILLVDDTPANLLLLSEMLKDRGYKLRAVPSGRLALKAARALAPDLVLLDIRMPAMDGYEVCERMKADAALKEIPIVFLSALSETKDKVKALAAGGVDFITKPFQLEEVVARVETHLALRWQKRQIEESYESLRRLESLRDSLTHMVIHDLRAPLIMVGDFLALLETSEARNLSKNGASFIRQARRAVHELVELVGSMLDISKMEAGEMRLDCTRCQLNHLIREAMDSFKVPGDLSRITLDAPEPPVEVSADPSLLSRVARNLFSNALNFASGPGGVRVAISRTERSARVTVTDDGPGIPSGYHQKIFEKYGQVEDIRAKAGTGLGLAFCKFAIELHGGRIGVESEGGKGSTFWFTLPLLG